MSHELDGGSSLLSAPWEDGVTGILAGSHKKGPISPTNASRTKASSSPSLHSQSTASATAAAAAKRRDSLALGGTLLEMDDDSSNVEELASSSVARSIIVSVARPLPIPKHNVKILMSAAGLNGSGGGSGSIAGGRLDHKASSSSPLSPPAVPRSSRKSAMSPRQKLVMYQQAQERQPPPNNQPKTTKIHPLLAKPTFLKSGREEKEKLQHDMPFKLKSSSNRDSAAGTGNGSVASGMAMNNEVEQMYASLSLLRGLSGGSTSLLLEAENQDDFLANSSTIAPLLAEGSSSSSSVSVSSKRMVMSLDIADSADGGAFHGSQYTTLRTITHKNNNSNNNAEEDEANGPTATSMSKNHNHTDSTASAYKSSRTLTLRQRRNLEAASSSVSLLSSLSVEEGSMIEDSEEDLKLARAVEEASLADPSFLVTSGYIRNAAIHIVYTVREFFGTCFSIEFIVPTTKQSWVVFIPSSEAITVLMRIWSSTPNESNSKKIGRWLLSCTTLEVRESAIVAAKFDHETFRKKYAKEVARHLHQAARVIQTCFRAFRVYKHSVLSYAKYVQTEEYRQFTAQRVEQSNIKIALKAIESGKTEVIQSNLRGPVIRPTKTKTVSLIPKGIVIQGLENDKSSKSSKSNKASKAKQPDSPTSSLLSIDYEGSLDDEGPANLSAQDELEIAALEEQIYAAIAAKEASKKAIREWTTKYRAEHGNAEPDQAAMESNIGIFVEHQKNKKVLKDLENLLDEKLFGAEENEEATFNNRGDFVDGENGSDTLPSFLQNEVRAGRLDVIEVELDNGDAKSEDGVEAAATAEGTTQRGEKFDAKASSESVSASVVAATKKGKARDAAPLAPPRDGGGGESDMTSPSLPSSVIQALQAAAIAQMQSQSKVIIANANAKSGGGAAKNNNNKALEDQIVRRTQLLESNFEGFKAELGGAFDNVAKEMKVLKQELQRTALEVKAQASDMSQPLLIGPEVNFHSSNSNNGSLSSAGAATSLPPASAVDNSSNNSNSGQDVAILKSELQNVMQMVGDLQRQLAFQKQEVQRANDARRQEEANQQQRAFVAQQLYEQQLQQQQQEAKNK